MKPDHIGHWLFTEEGLVRGYLRIEDDLVAELCRGEPPSGSLKALVIPSFINAHTHLGDSVAYPAPRASLIETVAPPDGYKYRMLRSASREAKVEAMKASLDTMGRTGTSAFVDFREEGLKGIQELREAAGAGWPRSVALGRPVETTTDDTEISLLLEVCDGIGVSSLSDWPLDAIRNLAARARSAGRLFAMHASEAAREDIDSILDLRPDMLVHMTQATDDDLAKVALEHIPVVVCARSNLFFGLRPPVRRLLRSGVPVCLGTDNAMTSVPDMLEELKAVYSLGEGGERLSPAEAVHLATHAGHKVLNGLRRITRTAADWTDLAVVAVGGEDPLGQMVTKSTSADIVAVVREGKVRRTRPWST